MTACDNGELGLLLPDTVVWHNSANNFCVDFCWNISWFCGGGGGGGGGGGLAVFSADIW